MGARRLAHLVVFAMVFLIPFVVLLSSAVKSHARGLTAIALVVIVGLWLERFILVSPSLWHGAGVPLGILEILITAGVLGLFVVCYTSFLRTFPVLAISPQPSAGQGGHHLVTVTV